MDVKDYSEQQKQDEGESVELPNHIWIRVDDTYDQELNAIKFIQRAVRDLDTEAKWRVIDYATRKIRADTYGSENVGQGGTR